VEIVELFSKRIGDKTVKPTHELELHRGQGVAGDVHQQVGSPRQVLLASAPYLQELGLAPGDLQENIVVDGAIDGTVEQLGSGRVLQLGQTAQVRLTFLCEPCAYLEQVQPGLVKRSLGKRGMLGMVIAAGVVWRGDAVTVLPQQFPVLPERAGDRFTEFVARIPPGKVVRTTELLLALGLTPSYYRTIPTFLKKAAADVPIHRILAADSSLMSRHMPQQMQRLQAEGVEVVNQRVAALYYWQPLYFHDLSVHDW
jgi:alkylated DNA nucleotide flippase Atl1